MWDRNEPRFLIRRVLLIVPNLLANLSPPIGNIYSFQPNDISAHPENNTTASAVRWVPNSLADVTKPENRFSHMNLSNLNYPQLGNNNNAASSAGNLPNICQLLPYNATAGSPNAFSVFALGGDQLGEDIMVQNLLAFDVRVWDPLAPLLPNDNSGSPAAALTPSDPGFAAAAKAGLGVIGRGAYVDLGYNRKILQADNSLSGWVNSFSGLLGPDGYVSPAGNPLGSFANRGSYYDTWTTSYDHDGIDQFGDSVMDTGNDGIDNDNANGVDDPAERETKAPYDFALRGIQIRIRVYEPNTRQVRQATVATDFIKE